MQNRSDVTGIRRAKVARKRLRPAAVAVVSGVILATSAALGAATGVSSGSVVAGVLPATTLVTTDNVLPGLSNATLLGAAPAGTQLTVDIGFTNPNAASELAEYNALYDPSSPSYHQFLTPSQFDTEFAMPASVLSGVTSWLHSAGLSPTYVSSSGQLVAIRGTVAQLSSLFRTAFDSYQVGSIPFIANTAAPTVPADLDIDDVVGLNTLQRMWTEGQIDQLNGTPESLLPSSLRTAASTQLELSGYNGTLMAQDLWGVYDATPCLLDGTYDPTASGLTNICPATGADSPAGPANATLDQPDVAGTPLDLGQGETAGMFGSGYSNGVISDLREWEDQMGLPQVPVRVVDESAVTSPPVPSDNDNVAEDEWNLDNQAITGMAPRLSQDDLYFASTPFDADTAIMFSAWANDPYGPKQMNASFGECGEDPTSPYLSSAPPLDVGQGLLGNQLQLLSDQSLEQAVLEGRTLFASAGDTAGSCPSVILPVVGAGNGIVPQPAGTQQNYPCDSLWAVCVGGTVVTTNGTTNPNTAGQDLVDDGNLDPTTPYTDAPYRVAEDSWAYTGGGAANNEPEPSWQQGVANIDKPCTSPLDTDGNLITPGTICRAVPDVAAMSGDSLPDGEAQGPNGYLVDIDYEQLGSGGTSLSSPLTVGMWSRIQAASPEVDGTYPGLGFADPLFYSVGKNSSEYATDFYNVSTCEIPVVCNFYNPQLPAGDSPSSEVPDGTGWNYNSGWGALDVDRFIADPDIDNDPALLPTHPADLSSTQPGETSVAPIASTCSLNLTAPLGNALDPTLSVEGSYTNDPSVNFTQASVSVEGQDLVATIAGPSLSTTPPPDAVDGVNYYVMLNEPASSGSPDGRTFFITAALNPGEDNGLLPGPPTGTLEGTFSYGDGYVESGTLLDQVNSDSGSFGNVNGMPTITITVPFSNLLADGLPSTSTPLSRPFVWDNIPNGVFVAFATDEAVPPDPSVEFDLAECG